MRNSCDIIVEIDVVKAMEDGYKFLKSKNDVILLPGKGPEGQLPPCYFKNVWYKPKSNGKLDPNPKQEITFDMTPYPYLLVLDFEANCVENAQLPCQEIIEFPVVPIDTKTLKIMDDKIFHQYVKPTVVPKITEFCTGLTGIKQETVDAGISIVETLENLDKWMTSNGFTSKNSTFVTCGRWDLSTCLKKEAEYKKITLPDYLRKYINVKDAWMVTFFKNKAHGMPGMLQSLDLELDGKHHSGIDDSKNIAKIAIGLIKKRTLFSRTQDIIVKPHDANTMEE
jgi:ERI1 exoribonuclease 3